MTNEPDDSDNSNNVFDAALLPHMTPEERRELDSLLRLPPLTAPELTRLVMQSLSLEQKGALVRAMKDHLTSRGSLNGPGQHTTCSWRELSPFLSPELLRVVNERLSSLEGGA